MISEAAGMIISSSHDCTMSRAHTGHQGGLSDAACTHATTHTHTHNGFTAFWILSGTTWVCWYHNRHSPTRTYRGHHSSLICFIHHILHVQFMCLTDFFQNLSPSFLWSTSWPGTLHFILHTFLYSIILFFSQHMPIPLQPVLL